MMDCINSSIKVLCDSNSKNGKFNYKKNILLSNYNNLDQTFNLIYNFIKKKQFKIIFSKANKFPKNLWIFKFTRLRKTKIKDAIKKDKKLSRFFFKK